MSAEVHIFRPRDLLRTMKRAREDPLFDSMRDKKSQSRKFFFEREIS